ncbi:MAG: DsbA family protein [Alphaproteobacteria bacterium]
MCFRAFFALFLFVFAASPLAMAQADPTKDELLGPRPNDIVLGQADAPVTIIEYASLSCSHCADFYKNTVSALKTNEIPAGTVRLVFRHFAGDPFSLNGALLSLCMPQASQDAYIATLLANQQTWLNARGDLEPLKTITLQAGLSDDAISTCWASKTQKDALLQTRLDAEKVLGVESTPTLFVNGEKMVGAVSLETLREKIAAIQGKQ